MHSCPECGSACYCGRDVDDIDTGDTEAEENCICCLDAWDSDDEEYWDSDEEEWVPV